MPDEEEWVPEESARIRDVMRWPNYPILPMKRGFGRRAILGVLLADDLRTVWLTNIASLKSGDVRSQLAGVESLTFASVEEMVEAGWMGD